MSADRPDGVHPDDELVSAYLDDEVTAAERARVDGDERLMARVEELRAVQQALRTPVEQLADADADRLVAAALAAATSAPDAPAAPGAPAPPVGLAARRRARGVPAWLSVAAVVLALLLAVPLLASLGGDDDGVDQETAATSADDSGGDSSGGAEGAPGAGGEGGAAASDLAAAPTDGGDLGIIDGEDALRAVVGPAVGTATLASPAPAGGAPAPDEAGQEDGAAQEGAVEEDADGASRESVTAFAQATPCAQTDLGVPSYQATARYQGVDAVVLAFTVPEGTRVRVLAVDDCRVLADLTL